MRLLLDSANLEEIKSIIKSNAVAGVTTNPSLVAKESKGKYIDKVLSIAQAIEDSGTSQFKHLSVEAISTDPKEIEKQSIEISERFSELKLSKIDLFLKVPVTFQNLNVITALAYKGISVNATACMTAMQAKLASDAGARVVSFFYNRIKDGQGNPNEVIGEFMTMNHNAQVICGSIRLVQDVLKAWEFGADYVTASSKIIEKMTQHEQTDKAIAQFQQDIDSWLS